MTRGSPTALLLFVSSMAPHAEAQNPPPPAPPERFLGAYKPTSAVISTCSAHFATPCAISLVHDVVLNVTNAFQPNNAYATFQSINSGFYNHDFLFWPTVLSSSGAVVASGRRVAAAGVGLTYVPDHTNANFELSEATETDVTQTGVFGRIVAAANGDGYFTHLSRDLYAGHARTFRSRDEWSGHDAVHRVGFVRRIVATGGQVYYVLCSFTDLPNGEPDALQPCSPSNDGLCALAYTRKVLGVVTSMMLKAADEAALQLLLGRVTWRDFNEQGAPGFYPFIYKLDSTCVAHGANPTNVGRRLPDIIAGVPRLANLAGLANLNGEFVSAASQGGGWVGYNWTNSATEPSYLKIAYIVGVRRFGTAYYIGVGFNHEEEPRAQGPHCEACRQDYNYPCAWANVLGLVGHAQSLMFIDNVYGLSTAFQKLTYESAYGGGGRTAGRAARSADWLYVFMYRFDGTCVAHGARSDFVGRTLQNIIAGAASLRGVITGSALHQSFVNAANQGGAWVPYPWKNAAGEPVYNKVSYIVKVVRGGQDYYLGVGLSDNLWSTVGAVQASGGKSRWLDGCSPDRKHPCAEDWAHHVAGLAMRDILTASSYNQLAAWLRVPLQAVDSQFGFQYHVHNDQIVLGEGYQPSYVGRPTSDWLQAVELDSSNLAGCRSTGVWLQGGSEGAFNLKLKSGSANKSVGERFYLYCISVPVGDVVADGVEDGAFDTLTVIIAVSAGRPMNSLSMDGACYERPYELSGGRNSGNGSFSDWSFNNHVVCRDDVDEHNSKCDPDLYGICPSAAANEGWASSGGSGCVWPGWYGRPDLECGCSDEYDTYFADERPLVTTCSASTDPIAYKLQMTYEQVCALRTKPFPVMSVLVPIIVVIVIALILGAYMKYNKDKQVAKLKKQLDEFNDQVVGVMAVTQDFDPRENPNYKSPDIARGIKKIQETAKLSSREVAPAAKKPMRSSTYTPNLYPSANVGRDSEQASAEDKAKVEELRSAFGRPAGESTHDVVDFVSEALGVSTTLADGSRRTEVLLDRCYNLIFGEVSASSAAIETAEVDLEAPPHRPKVMMELADWYWQEDESMIGKHNRNSVIEGNFVRYAGSVMTELDRKYHQFIKEGGPQKVQVDLNARIGSTGTEAKAQNQHTGAIFEIDFTNWKQRNVKSSFVRTIKRVPNGKTLQIGGGEEAKRGTAPTPEVLRQSSKAPLQPKEIEEEDALILRKGQLVQTSKVRPDGWAFGSVVYDVVEGRPPIGVDGLSTQAGWFPTEMTTHPSKEQMLEMQKMLGGGDDAGNSLRPPPDWEPMADPTATKLFELKDGQEKERVVSAFQKTLGRQNIKVTEVHRVQNMSMWQSFAVKRQSILTREGADPSNMGNDFQPSRFERVWLFHGTDQETVPKITQQGFNRSFCGKNATAFGKGVYFARDAAYSAQPQYARPNNWGVCQMFLCRVAVGEYCLGKRDALTPDVRKGHQLYDTTIGPNMSDPYIFVTYHDAQAYPEYLVKYKR